MKKEFVLALLLFVCALPIKYADAIFYNDSDVIEIGDGVPPAPVESGNETAGTSGGAGGGTGGSTVTEGGYGGSSSGSGTSGGAGTGSGTGVGEPGTEGGGAPSTNSTANGNANTSSEGGGSGAETPESIISLLIDSGAISGPSVLNQGAGSSLSGSPNEGVVGITVNGAKVRAFFRSKYDLQDILQNWRGSASGDAKNYGFIAASTVLRDRNVQSVSFTAEKFEIAYRARGYALAIFPVTFPVWVSIVPEATTGRVSVRLPWYRFLVREFFTPKKLAEEIDLVIVSTLEAGIPVGGDVKALVFDVVAKFLGKKIGTISDTIYLGVEEKQ